MESADLGLGLGPSPGSRPRSSQPHLSPPKDTPAWPLLPTGHLHLDVRLLSKTDLFICASLPSLNPLTLASPWSSPLSVTSPPSIAWSLKPETWKPASLRPWARLIHQQVLLFQPPTYLQSPSISLQLYRRPLSPGTTISCLWGLPWPPTGVPTSSLPLQLAPHTLGSQSNLKIMHWMVSLPCLGPLGTFLGRRRAQCHVVTLLIITTMTHSITRSALGLGCPTASLTGSHTWCHSVSHPWRRTQPR